jgi:hypothetical protein
MAITFRPGSVLSYSLNKCLLVISSHSHTARTHRSNHNTRSAPGGAAALPKSSFTTQPLSASFGHFPFGTSVVYTVTPLTGGSVSAKLASSRSCPYLAEVGLQLEYPPKY